MTGPSSDAVRFERLTLQEPAMTRIAHLAFLAAAGALALTGCSREERTEQAEAGNEMIIDNATGNNAMVDGTAAGTTQSASFTGAAGAALGTVTVGDGAGGVTMTVAASGMPAGVHGFHLHEKGLCEGPKFESAGAHWNPGAKKHGRDNPEGAHLGDLANLEVDGSGSGSASFTVAGAMMASGSTMLADADGTALVVHAKPDDYKTDPSGNSGDRIACAVVAPPK